MDLYIPVVNSDPVVSPQSRRTISFMDLHIGYLTAFNLYFLSPDILDQRCPWNLTRYAGAAITMQLKQDGIAAIATQATWAEVVPAWADPSSLAITVTIASPGVVTWTAHGFANGQAVVFTTTGALPTGIVANQVYFVISQATNTFQLSATYNGPAINTSGSQSGTHTGYAVHRITRVQSGVTGQKGEYDRIQLAAAPASGSFLLNLRGGQVQTKGAVSASARIYPGLSSSSDIEAPFAAALGAPYSAEIISPSLIDIHGSTCPTGTTTPFIQECNVSDLNFLFGWSGNLDLTAVAANQSGLANMYLIVLLTPSGGVQQRVMKIPVNLLA
jgi:hypothetical protein